MCASNRVCEWQLRNGNGTERIVSVAREIIGAEIMLWFGSRRANKRITHRHHSLSAVQISLCLEEGEGLWSKHRSRELRGFLIAHGAAAANCGLVLTRMFIQQLLSYKIVYARNTSYLRVQSLQSYLQCTMFKRSSNQQMIQ